MANNIAAEIILEKHNRTYSSGERIRGFLQIRNIPNSIAHGGIVISLEGQIKSQVSVRAVGALDTLLSQIPPQTLCKVTETVLPEGVFNQQSIEIPFELPLRPIQDQYLLESYTGVYISIQYEIKAGISKAENSRIVLPTVSPVRILVKIPGLGLSEGTVREPRPINFQILPDGLENPNKLKSLPNFRITGNIECTLSQIDQPFRGYLTIEHSESRIRSIDLQLIRVETVTSGREGNIKEATEVQSIQLADGNVAHNTPILLYMLYPRQFSCPTTIYRKFKIEFEVNIIIVFEEGIQITKNFPITLFRQAINL